MSLVELNFDDVYEPEVLADDTECQVRISSATEYHSEKSGKDSIKIVLDDPTNDKIEDITIYLGLPIEGDEPKKNNKKKNAILSFYAGFGIDHSQGVDLDNIVGMTANVILGLSKSDDFGEQNFIRKYV